MRDFSEMENDDMENLNKEDWIDFLHELSDTNPELVRRAGLLLKLNEMGIIDQDEMYHFADLLDPNNEKNP